jgi:hypothetical protein
VEPNIDLVIDIEEEGFSGLIVLCFRRYLSHSDYIRDLDTVLRDSCEFPREIQAQKIDRIIDYKSI